mmetsp:Transcript_5243/g.7575  ORF Transcript_5243/g.7575 Transcript_5243/m.7575 type:complete len:485 (-) Transcript_5243:148-1602(-)
MSAIVLPPLEQNFKDEHEDDTMMQGIEFSSDALHESKIMDDSSVPSLSNDCVMDEINSENESPITNSLHGGLSNLGNTCYLNSAVQMLTTLDNFIFDLESQRPINKEDNNKLMLREELLKLARGLRKGETVHPANFKEAVDITSSLFVGYRQQDSHEFLTTVLELLDELYKLEANENDSTEKDENSGDSTPESETEKKSESNEETKSGLKRNLTELCLEDISTLLHGDDKREESRTSEISKSNEKSQCKLIGGRAVISEDSSVMLLKNGESSEVTASHLVESRQNDEQHDRQEDDTSSPVDTYFATEVRSRLTCDSCKYSRSQIEKYLHLSIDIGTTSGSVEEGLRNFFAPEQREIKCEKCFCETATQRTEITRLPKALMLHFKRFIVDVSPDYSSITYRKNQSIVNFPDVLKTGVHEVLTEFLSEDVAIPERSPLLFEEDFENMARQYKITSIVNHIGSSASCGHYTADASRNYSGEKKMDAI